MDGSCSATRVGSVPKRYGSSLCHSSWCTSVSRNWRRSSQSLAGLASAGWRGARNLSSGPSSFTGLWRPSLLSLLRRSHVRDQRWRVFWHGDRRRASLHLLEAVLDRLGNMLCGDPFGAGKIGDGARQFQYPVIPARRQVELPHGAL